MTARVQDPATVADDEASALALAASIRIVKGNPTAEEVATLAALLIARLRLQHEARAARAQAAPETHGRPPRHLSPFTSPGAWAS